MKMETVRIKCFVCANIKRLLSIIFLMFRTFGQFIKLFFLLPVGTLLLLESLSLLVFSPIVGDLVG